MILTLATMRQKLTAWVPGFSPPAYDEALNRAYNNLAQMYAWTDLQTEFQFVTKASVDTGGADFNSGAATITASTTVSAAWTSVANCFAGMFIKKVGEAGYYTITSNTSVLVTITESYPGKSTTAAASSGDSYSIFKHIYAISSTIETVEKLMHNSYLEEMDDLSFEIRDPDLEAEGEPSKWRNAGITTAGVTLVQLYPPRLNDIYELRGRGRLKVEAMTGTSTPLLDSNVIMAFAEVDLLKRKRILSPEVVTEQMLESSTNNANTLFIAYKDFDERKGTNCRYVHDNFFSRGYRGHQWFVEHDPQDAF